MRSRSFITARPVAAAAVSIIAMVCTLSTDAQTVAIVTPNATSLDRKLAENIRAELDRTLRVRDLEMSEAAFSAAGRGPTAFNMTADDTRVVASILGCDFCILIRSGTQRRAEIGRPDYFESFAAYYVVSGRTGRLIKWQLASEKGADESDSEHRLTHAGFPAAILDAIESAWKTERNEPPVQAIEQIPEDGSPAAKNFRPPVPFRRLKPEYTRTAYLYDITATVEATVDLNEKGEITRLEITRWAGYGLDESVVKIVRSMNWRPAERNGKPLAARFLLRYNFRKIEKDDNE